MVLSNSLDDYILAILIYLLGALHVMINIYGFLAKKLQCMFGYMISTAESLQFISICHIIELITSRELSARNKGIMEGFISYLGIQDYVSMGMFLEGEYVPFSLLSLFQV